MSGLTITVRTFKRLVEPVMPLAGTDRTLPILNAVLIETRGGYLTASATDRFRAGVQRVAGEWPEFRALVPLSSLRAILATFKPGRAQDPELVLTIDGDLLNVEAGGAMEFGFVSAQIGYPLESGKYPDLRRLLREAADRGPGAESVRYDWTLLAGFRAVQTAASGGLTVQTHPTKACFITDGQDFIGALMPMKAVGQPDLSSWESILGEPANAEAVPS